MQPLASIVNPQMVTLARLSRGLTQAELASQIGAAQGTVSKIEAGSAGVDSQQLSAISNALGYPESFFAANDDVDGPGLPELYHERRRKTMRTVVLSKAYATATIRRMHVNRLLRAVPEADPNFPAFLASEFDNPAMAARTLRAHWELPAGPIFSMTTVIEQAGGIVIECDFESRHIDGFSKWKRPDLPPLFLINRALPPDRWRWTLAHELGHLVMHNFWQAPRGDIEREADTFAEEFLTPEHYIKPQLLAPTLPKLTGLKLHWKVSIQALINRAYHLELLSSRQRSYMFTQWSRAGYRLREPEDLDPPKEPPKRLSEIVQFHLHELGFSVPELAEFIGLSEAEFRGKYLPGAGGLTLVK